MLSNLAILEKWAEETHIENLSWHELMLLKSFYNWLELSGLTPRAADASPCSSDTGEHYFITEEVCVFCHVRR